MDFHQYKINIFILNFNLLQQINVHHVQILLFNNFLYVFL